MSTKNINQLGLANNIVDDDKLIVGQSGALKQSTIGAFFNRLVTMQSVKLNSGTANGVLYLDGSKVATSGSALVFDGSNLGLGVTPSAWNAGAKAAQVGSTAALWSFLNGLYLSNNRFFDAGGANKYIISAAASAYEQSGGSHVWLTAPSGIAGDPISFTQAMTLDVNSNLLTGGLTSYPGQADLNSAANGAVGLNTKRELRWSSTNASIYGGAGGADDNLYYHTGNSHIWRVAGTERARITSSGYFKASNTGVYRTGDFTNEQWHESSSNSGANPVFDATSTASTYTDSVIRAFSAASASVNFRLYEGYAAGNKVYQVLGNGNVQNTNNSYGAISDIKLKENITAATPKLASLNQLRVVNYNLIGSELKQIGLIAQEVEQVFPGLVESTPDIDSETKEPTGTVTKSIKYSVLVPILIQAVKELTTRIEQLEQA